MKFYLSHGYLDKALPYLNALNGAGHVRTEEISEASFIICDFIRRPYSEPFRNVQKPIFVYPHAPLGIYMWDGLVPNHVPVARAFVFGEGQKKAMESYGYPYPITVSGWSYSQIGAFQSASDIKSILFAPKHPNGPRALMEEDRKLNQVAMKWILRRRVGRTTVYHGHQVQHNGLQLIRDLRVHYVQSRLTLAAAIEQIQAHDVVVAHDTFAYLAIALGKPTIMFVGDQVPHILGRRVASWEKYRDIVHYPFDLALWDNEDLLFHAAAVGGEKITTWKDRMIGTQFDPQKFVLSIEECLWKQDQMTPMR